ncbi:hypothetical protein [Stenotrophomonas rhizophila]|uniref:hypothetical protein n=1 Tax=Stenotrophomonas rhizophila TaxID=216778 RepID=UPI001E65A70F|nr:hypothetical protein [Stenotrophomonas rhizophila]MCC7633834.1 hypothetical protein [Stenotrophomonas rhizophila]MCC7665396.1 hypothetical protein [Stenotrophomonas rhizophila]
MAIECVTSAYALAARALTAMLGLLLAGAASASCELSLGMAEADLGRIVPAEVNPQHRVSGDVSLGRQMGTLNIICSVPTRLELHFRAPVVDGRGYRVDLGGGSGEARLGVMLSHASADGRPVSLASLHHPERQGNALAMTPDDGLRLLVDGTDAAVRSFSAQVEIEVSAPASALRANVDLRLQGQGHFEAVERP